MSIDSTLEIVKKLRSFKYWTLFKQKPWKNFFAHLQRASQEWVSQFFSQPLMEGILWNLLTSYFWVSGYTEFFSGVVCVVISGDIQFFSCKSDRTNWSVC